MKTYSVSLSDGDAAILESAASRYPGITTHMIHVALLRISLKSTDTTTVTAELAQIQAERRRNRRATTEHEPSPGDIRSGDDA